MSVVDIDNEDDDKWLDYVSSLTPLARAELFVKSARDGERWRCEQLIEKGVDANFRDGQALVAAAGKGRMGVLTLLLTKNMNQSAKDSALVEATVGGREDIVNVLLANGADASCDDSSALWYCAMHGRDKIADTLLKSGADVNAHNKELLCIALAHGFDDVATVFLKHGASPANYYRSLNAFEWAAETGQMEFAKTLRQWVNSDEHIGPAHFRAQSLEDLRRVLPERGGRTGFHVAAAAGSFDVICEKILNTENEQMRVEDLTRIAPPAGPSVLAVLGQVGQLSTAFNAALWAGRKDDMLKAYAAVPAAYRDQIDMPAVVSAIDHLTIKPKPGKFTLKP